jgi:hypothetical protein
MEWILGLISVLGTFAVSGAWRELGTDGEAPDSEETVFYG